MSLASRHPCGGQGPAPIPPPPPSIPSSPLLPSAQPCQAAGGRGFTTQGRLFSNSGTHCRAARAGMAGAAINTTGTGLAEGGVSTEGQPHQRQRRSPLRITKKTQLRWNSTWMSGHGRSVITVLLIRGSICWGAVEFQVVVLLWTRKEGTGTIRRPPFYIYIFSALLCQRDISSGALYTRFITSKQKYYLPRLPFITRAARHCEWYRQIM